METVTLDKQSYAHLCRDHGKKDVDRLIRAVNRGAKALDEKKPRWVYDVVPEKLDMSHTTMCVCGQVFGHYCHRTVAPRSLRQVIRLGFFSEYLPHHEVLDELWSALIVARHLRRRRVFLKAPARA